MKYYLLTLLLAFIYLPAFAQNANSDFKRHHLGIDFIYIPQYAPYSKDNTYYHQYNRLGGDISYRFCIFSILRAGVQYEISAPQRNTTSSGDGSLGFTLDFPIWIHDMVAIVPGAGTNIMPTGGNTLNISTGWYMNVMARVTNSIAVSTEFGIRKIPNGGYRQYPVRIGLKVLL